MPIVPEPERFHDPDQGPGAPITVRLCRVPEAGPEKWFLEQDIAYDDRELKEIVVPRDRKTFRTDLTSVPQLFTWLVTKTGIHLPAALVHDALTPPFSEPDAPDWKGPPAVSRLQADRVFRDAMADLGTPTCRRWLIWSAVSIPTAWSVDRARALLGYVALVAIGIAGWFATLDLFDQGSWMPWMGDHSWVRELLLGGLGAVLIPLALSVLWPAGVRAAGAIAGVAIAALFHVTIAVGAVTCAYQLVEFRHRAWGPPRAGLKVGLTVVAVAVAVVTIIMCRRY
jgi:hypothetical protein